MLKRRRLASGIRLGPPLPIRLLNSLGPVVKALGLWPRIDVPALRESGMSIHQIGPTQHGYVRVAVERDARAAQAKLDAMLGPDVIRVLEAPRAQTLPYRGPGTPG